MVKRQADIDAVLRRAAQSRSGRQSGGHQVAAIRHHRSLGQARGAGSKDVHGGLTQGDLCRFGRILHREIGACRRHLDGPVGHRRAIRRPIRNDEVIGALLKIELVFRLIDRVLNLAAEHTLPGRSHVDTVNERPSSQVGVDQPRGNAKLVGRDQKGQKLDSVLHHDADSIARAKTRPLEKVRVTVGARIESFPGDGLAFADDGRQRAEVSGGALNDGAQAILLVEGTRLHALLQRQQHRHVPQHRNDFTNIHGGYSERFTETYTRTLSKGNLRLW